MHFLGVLARLRGAPFFRAESAAPRASGGSAPSRQPLSLCTAPEDSPTAEMDGTSGPCACAHQAGAYWPRGEVGRGVTSQPIRLALRPGALPAACFWAPAVALVTAGTQRPASRYFQGDRRSVALPSQAAGRFPETRLSGSQEEAGICREGWPNPWAFSAFSRNFSSEGGAGVRHSTTTERPAGVQGQQAPIC